MSDLRLYAHRMGLTALVFGLAVGPAACGSSDEGEQSAAGATVRVGASGFTIEFADGKKVESGPPGVSGGEDPARPGDAYAAFATTRFVSRDIEEIYGFFRFDDALEPYVGLRIAEVEVTDSGLSFALVAGEDDTAHGKGSLVIEDGQTARLRLELDGERSSVHLACTADERFFGLGAQISHEHRGRRVPIWVSEQGIGKGAPGVPPPLFGLNGAHYDSYAPIPFVLSSRNVGTWLDSSARAEVELCEKDGSLRVEVDHGTIDLVFFSADRLADTHALFTGRTGRPGPIARWALAPWVDIFGGPAAIDAAMNTLRDNDIPASVVWAEDWVGTVAALGGENLTYDWQEDPNRYPDLAAVTGAAHAQGFRFMTYINPFLPSDTQIYADASAAGATVHLADGSEAFATFPWGEPPALFDPTAPGADALFAEYLGRAADAGVDGWMADYAEALPFDAVLADGTPGALAHNRYPLHWAEASRDFWRARRPDADYATFSRSGFTGAAASVYIHWLGDQTVNFDRNDGFGSVVPLYLSAGMSGLALTHSDVGGYTSVASTVRSPELMARWLAFEAFTPFLRTHHTSAPAANIQWHSDADNLAWTATYFRWHQALAPYFATLVEEAQARGTPAVRPLFWEDDGENAHLYSIDDEVLVGRNLLLAPIVTAATTQRTVQFPRGGWRRWWTLDGALDAPETSSAEAHALAHEPLLWVRGGAALPLLLDSYDTLAPTRDGTSLDPEVDAAPATIDRLHLLLVAGGSDNGSLSFPGFATTRWSWEGAGLADGPLTAATLGGTDVGVCAGDETECLTAGVLRLGPASFDGAPIELTTASGSGVLGITSNSLAEMWVEVR